MIRVWWCAVHLQTYKTSVGPKACEQRGHDLLDTRCGWYQLVSTEKAATVKERLEAANDFLRTASPVSDGDDEPLEHLDGLVDTVGALLE